MNKHSYRNYSTSTPISSQYNKNISPSYTSKSPGFLQTMKDGFALGIGSSVGQLITNNILGGPKVNVEHTYVNDNVNKTNPYITTQNCSEILLEYEKCKGDYNCNFDKLNELKNNYENCKNNK